MAVGVKYRRRARKRSEPLELKSVRRGVEWLGCERSGVNSSGVNVERACDVRGL